MMPSPPAAVTAPASAPPATSAIGASSTGCLMSRRSVRRVERGIENPRNGYEPLSRVRERKGPVAQQREGEGLWPHWQDGRRPSIVRSFLATVIVPFSQPARDHADIEAIVQYL